MKEETKKQLLQIVKSNYKEIAKSFDVSRHKHIWPEIKKVAEIVKTGDRVLDLGCGNGRLLEALKGKEIEYLGIDNNQELLELARTKYNNDFVLGDLLALEKIREKPFNHIFCLATLQHVPSQELRLQALQKMKDQLEPGGSIIISNWNFFQGKHRKKIYLSYFKKWFGLSNLDSGDILFYWKNSQGEEVSQRYYHAFTKKELKSLAIKAGLSIKKLYKDKYNYWLILKKKDL